LITTTIQRDRPLIPSLSWTKALQNHSSGFGDVSVGHDGACPANVPQKRANGARKAKSAQEFLLLTAKELWSIVRFSRQSPVFRSYERLTGGLPHASQLVFISSRRVGSSGSTHMLYPSSSRSVIRFFNSFVMLVRRLFASRHDCAKQVWPPIARRAVSIERISHHGGV
jgi:hypothetical protein